MMTGPTQQQQVRHEHVHVIVYLQLCGIKMIMIYEL